MVAVKEVLKRYHTLLNHIPLAVRQARWGAKAVVFGEGVSGACQEAGV